VQPAQQVQERLAQQVLQATLVQPELSAQLV
jgi:hypothetical protein